MGHHSDEGGPARKRRWAERGEERRKQKPPGPEQAAPALEWRTAVPSERMEKALLAFRDLCFRPADSESWHFATLAASHHMIGKASVLLQALYDRESMEYQRKTPHTLCHEMGTAQIAQNARTLLSGMLEEVTGADAKRHLQRYLHKPRDGEEAPRKKRSVSLGNVLYDLIEEIERDFGRELDLSLGEPEPRPAEELRVFHPGNGNGGRTP